MALNQEALKASMNQSGKGSQSSVHPKAPKQSADRYAAQTAQVSEQSQSAIALASQSTVAKAGQSLQSLDAKLSSFEEDYAKAAVQRINETPLRINARIAQLLTEQQQQADPLEALTVAVDSWEVPEFALPQLSTLKAIAGV